MNKGKRNEKIISCFFEILGVGEVQIRYGMRVKVIVYDVYESYGGL